MGDFGEGIDQENNMLGEMNGFNSQIKEAKQVRNQFLHGQLASAKEERAKESDPTKLGADVTQISQVASKTAEAKKVFKSSTYGSDLGAYAKGLGRTGEEFNPLTSVKAAGTKVSKVAGQVSDLASDVGQRVVATLPTQAGAEARVARAAGATGSSQAGLTEPIPDADRPATTTTGSAAEAPPTAEAAGAEGAGAEAESLASKGAKLAGTAGEVVGAVGVGLGVLGGAESLASDMAGGHFHLAGDNTAEKTGNALSMAGGALDTMSLVAPPLAILGGILGIASAISDGIGHLEHSAKKVAAVKKESAAPLAETPMGVTSLSAIGQVASQGSDMLHTITGTTAF